MKKYLILALFFPLLVGCDLMEMIPDYKFSTAMYPQLLCGEYAHKHPDFNANSSVLTLYADGGYKIEGSASEEFSFFPKDSGNFKVSFESFSIYRAEGVITFTGKNPIVGYEDLNTRRASFVWTVDEADEYIRTLTLVFSSDEVIEYEFMRTIV